MYPAYLLLGPESGEKSQFIKNLREECREKIGEEPELHRFYPFETENGEILQVLRNHSLFSLHQLVILSQLEGLNISQVQMIADYLASPSSSCTLILISSELKAPKKIDSGIDSHAKKIFWELFENKKRDWLTGYFRKFNLEIADEAVDLILELVENNTSDLRTTCSQLASYFMGRNESKTAAPSRDLRDMYEITESDVEQFIYHSRKENVFSLFAHIAEGDLRRTLDVYQTLYYSGEAEPAALFAGLLWQFRRLYSVIAVVEEGGSESEAFAKAAVLDRAAKINGKRNQQIYRSGAQNYSQRETAGIISLISIYDAMIKETGSQLQKTVIEKFLYEIIINKGIRSHASQLLKTYCSFL